MISRFINSLLRLAALTAAIASPIRTAREISRLHACMAEGTWPEK